MGAILTGVGRRDRVYLIRNGVGQVKIGRTRGDVERRLRELSTGSGTALTIAAVIDDVPPALERAFHREFADYRVHGEWFTDIPAIRERFTSIMAAEHRRHRNYAAAQARDRLNAVLGEEAPAIEDIEAAIAEKVAILDAQWCACFIETEDSVPAFWRAMRDRFAWDLIPFAFAHDLYRAWLTRSALSEDELGRNRFINALVAEVEADPQWRCLDQKTPVYTGDRMLSHEPLAEEFALVQWADGSAKKRCHRGILRVVEPVSP